jgi:hypothetical protein
LFFFSPIISSVSMSVNVTKLLGYTDLTYITLDRIMKAPIIRMFHIFPSFLSFTFLLTLLNEFRFIFFVVSLLRTQPSETEVEFFTDVEDIFVHIHEQGNVTLTNLRIIWYSTVNPDKNCCFIIRMNDILHFHLFIFCIYRLFYKRLDITQFVTFLLQYRLQHDLTFQFVFFFYR